MMNRVLDKAEIIERVLARMKKMVGFRNVAVHDYRELDWAILKSIVTRDLRDVRAYSAHVIKQFANN
ncbi:MAG: DUF86 domain-containing protein [Nitrosomonadales bacterium]|nr:DUF86 domain-containing protein [Nitrosomonadales bacterium]